MATIYYVKTDRWKDGKYQTQVAQIFHGEQPQFVEENGPYTGYSLETEPETTDQKWIVGSTRERMLRGGLITASGAAPEPREVPHSIAVRPSALKDPSIIDKRPIEWDDLTDDTKDLLSR